MMSRAKALSFVKKLYYNPRITWHKQNLNLLSGCKKILDVGCGKGLFLNLAPDRIIGVDYNLGSLKECADSGCTVVRGNVLHLPFPDQAFDGVHCADVIEHFSPVDVRRILDEICRVIKVGGAVVIATPLPSKMFWNDASHIRPYPPMALLSYFVPDESKGPGTQPTYNSLPYKMRIVKLTWRYTQFYQLPLQLYLPEWRMRLINLIRPSSLLFLLANLLSRIGINLLKPEGYVILLRKV